MRREVVQCAIQYVGYEASVGRLREWRCREEGIGGGVWKDRGGVICLQNWVLRLYVGK